MRGLDRKLIINKRGRARTRNLGEYHHSQGTVETGSVDSDGDGSLTERT